MIFQTLLRSCGVLSLALLFAVPAQAQNGTRIIHQERSLYTNVLVTEDSTRRCMRFTLTERSGQNQSCRFLEDREKLAFPYAKMVLSSLMVQDNPERILILGLGGGTLVDSYSLLFPEAEIIIVEIDRAVVEVAEEYFDFEESDRIKVETVDGRVYVKRAGLRKEKFDLVILDAFNGEYIPEHLMSQEFLEEVKLLLPEDGMVVANTFSASRLYDAESATYASVFGPLFNIRQFGTGNRVIIASMQPLPSLEVLQARAKALQPRLARFDMDVNDYPQLLDTEVDWNRNARLLTDQYSPANLLNN
ncbi:MAG TPA: fused MFS/spermidine synthase [Pseudomonadaceae bacterium]|nr:fused MFS/spermidine synthase [Pseudomonadaceae bacterium]